MKTKFKLDRRQLLTWSAPVVAAVTLPVHAMTSASFTVMKVQSGGPSPATSEGDVIEYTITVENTGSVDITGIVVTDTMPDNTVVILNAPSESLNSDNVLEVGESWVFTTTYTVTLSDLITGVNLINEVSVSANEVMDDVSDFVETSVIMLRACEGPPVLTVLAPPKCAGAPPIGSAEIEITAPGAIPMNLLSINVITSDPASTISLPTFPVTISDTSGVTITWDGPASDAITCLPLALISIEVEYACEDEVSLVETVDITTLLINSLP